VILALLAFTLLPYAETQDEKKLQGNGAERRR